MMNNISPNGGMPPTHRLPGVSMMSNLTIRRNVIVATGQRVYDNVPLYEKGSNNLWVFVNGKKEFCGTQLDYIEVSNSTIQFNKNIPRGAMIEFLVFESFTN